MEGSTPAAGVSLLISVSAKVGSVHCSSPGLESSFLTFGAASSFKFKTNQRQI